MTHRDVDGGDSVPRPDHPTDGLPTVHEVSGATLLPPRRLEAANEPALGATYRRNVEKDPEVRGQAHATRVREALGVQNQGVHPGLDLAQSPSERRHFPERKE